MIIEHIKVAVDNYLNNRQLTSIVTGTFNGSRVILNEKAYVPDSMLTGNLKSALKSGDMVRLLRNDGGREYYVMEIIGAPVRLQREETHENV